MLASASGSCQVQSEESIVRRAQHYDQEAFAQLYEEYFDKIYRYLVFKIGDRMEAEDMTQQVFLKALRSISSFKWKGISFSAWLYRIAHNEAVDFLRRKSKRVTVSLNESLVTGEDDPQLAAERKSDVEHLILATRQLTEAQREVIALRFASGLPVAEVAKVMSKSAGAVKALQHSAVVTLRRIMMMSKGNEEGC
jgi:RNA polymerase sigma-70 factor (ECF subfamily)